MEPVTVSVPVELPLWDEQTEAEHTARIVTDGSDRVAWHRARSRGVTATDAARLAGPGSIPSAVRAKAGGGFGNAFTEHGRAREPEIASWVQSSFGIDPNRALFRSRHHALHLATPDGIGVEQDGTLVLAEIKTTAKRLRAIPRHYLRQIWWQQYVLGASRTLFVWEEHRDFAPQPPCWDWVERDEAQIERLVDLAELLLRQLGAPQGGKALLSSMVTPP